MTKLTTREAFDFLLEDNKRLTKEVASCKAEVRELTERVMGLTSNMNGYRRGTIKPYAAENPLMDIFGA